MALVELTIAPVGAESPCAGWVVRHDRALFERFAERRTALRCAARHAAGLRRAGHAVRVRLDPLARAADRRPKSAAYCLAAGLGVHHCSPFEGSPAEPARLDARPAGRYPKAA